MNARPTIWIAVVIGCLVACWSPPAAPAQLTKDEVDKINKAIEQAQQEQRRAFLQNLLVNLDRTANLADQSTLMASLHSLNLPPEEGVSIYRQLLNHKSDWVIQGSLEALARYGAPAKPAGPRVMELLQNPKSQLYNKEQAALTLAAIGYHTPEAVDALVRQIENKYLLDSLTIKTARSLGQMGPAAKKAIPALFRLFDEPATAIQFEAYVAIGRIKAFPRSTLEQLRQLQDIDWKEGDGGYATLQALQDAGPKASFAVPVLLRFLHRKTPAYFRCLVVQTLGQVGGADPRAIKALLQEAGGKDVFLAGLAREGLTRVDPGARTCVPVLAAALRDGNPVVRLEAARTLVRFGRGAAPAVPAVVEALRSADGRLSADQVGTYLLILCHVGPEARAATDTLAGLLSKDAALYQHRSAGEVAPLRAHVLYTLGEVGVPRTALPAILEHLRKDNTGDGIAFAAGAHAAAALGAEAAPAVPELLTALRPNFHDRPLSFQQPFVANLYAHRPDGKSTSARLETVRALGRIGPAAHPAVPLLRELASAKQPGDLGFRARLAAEARQALKAIEGR